MTQAQAAGQALPEYLRGLTTPYQSPGQLISGIAHGVFPPDSLNLGVSGSDSSTVGLQTP